MSDSAPRTFETPRETALGLRHIGNGAGLVMGTLEKFYHQPSFIACPIL